MQNANQEQSFMTDGGSQITASSIYKMQESITRLESCIDDNKRSINLMKSQMEANQNFMAEMLRQIMTKMD
jgi:flagellar biosynthesis chaperone FliJ